MAKKIKNSDIFQGDLFLSQKDSAIAFLNVLVDLKKEQQELLLVYKDLIKNNPLKTYKDTKELDHLNKKIKILTDQITKLNTEEQKQVKTVKELTVDEAKLKVELQEKNRVTKLEAQATSKSVGAYKNLSAQLNLNKKTYKDLAALGLENTKQGKDLAKTIQEQDKRLKEIDATTGEFNRNVGNYKNSIIDAIKETGLLGDVTGRVSGVFEKATGVFTATSASIKNIINNFKENKKALQESAVGAKLYERALVSLRVTTLTLTTATKLLGLALKATGIGLIIGAIGALGVALTKTQKGADDVSVVMEGLKFALDEIIGAIGGVGFGLITLFKGLYNQVLITAKGFDILSLKFERAFEFNPQKVDEINKKINVLNTEVTELGKEKGVADGLKEIGQALDGIVGKTGDAFEAGKSLGRIIVAFRDQNLELRKELTVTDTQLAVANQKAGDATLSFKKRLEATDEAGQLQLKVSGAQVQIAKNNLEIINAELAAKQKAGLKDIELRERQVSAIEALDAAESKLEIDKLNRQTQIRQIREKQLISELLILEKQFDKISKFSEDEINNAENNISKRQELLKELQGVSAEIFESEIKSIEKLTGFAIDQSELIKESNAEILENKITSLNVSEDVVKALSKVIIQRQKQLLQEVGLTDEVNKQIERNNTLRKENAEALRDLGTESILIDLEKEIKLQKELIGLSQGDKLAAETEKLNDLTKDQFNLKSQLLKDNALDEISAAEQTIIEEDLKAQEILKINAKLANDLKRLENGKLDDIKENNKAVVDDKERQRQADIQFAIDEENKRIAAQKRLLEQIGEVTNTVITELDKQNQKKIQALDKDIDKRKENITKQEELAAKGLDNTLAFEQKRLAEAELEKVRLQDQQERREKRLAYLKAFSALLTEGDPNTAAIKALSQVVIAESIIRFLASGEENLKGAGSTTSDSIPAMLSRGESVVNAKGTAETKGLATLVNRKGLSGAHEWFEKNVLPKYLHNVTDMTSIPQFKTDNNAFLGQKIDKLNDTIKNKKEINVSWDGLEARYETMIMHGFKKTIKYVSKRPKI